MQYNLIRKMDISNGPGVRVSLFTQGCFHHCKNCFNPETWDLYGGKTFTLKAKEELFNLCNNEHCSGLSILGGEPLLMVNVPQLKSLFKEFKEEFPDKTIWLWTGYKVGELRPEQLEVLRLCDYFIDGRYEEDKRDLSLYYAGSTNQRLFKVTPNGAFLQEKMPRKNENL